jgi:serine/threonine protein kinase
MLHRDFKPQNVVVDGNLMPKIIDFGSSVSQFNKNSFESHDERCTYLPI